MTDKLFTHSYLCCPYRGDALIYEQRPICSRCLSKIEADKKSYEIVAMALGFKSPHATEDLIIRINELLRVEKEYDHQQSVINTRIDNSSEE